MQAGASSTSPVGWEHWQTSLAICTDSRSRVLGRSMSCGGSASRQMMPAAVQRWSQDTRALACRSTGTGDTPCRNYTVGPVRPVVVACHLVVMLLTQASGLSTWGSVGTFLLTVTVAVVVHRVSCCWWHMCLLFADTGSARQCSTGRPRCCRRMSGSPAAVSPSLPCAPAGAEQVMPVLTDHCRDHTHGDGQGL